MKKLICAEDVEAIKNKGQNILYIDCNTIITPLAKDAAKKSGIEFSTEVIPLHENNSPTIGKASGDEINSDMVYEVLKVMKDKGLLKEIINLLSNKPYVADSDPEGLKVVRGNTVEFEPFNTGNQKDKVFYQELIHKEDSSLSAGFLTIAHSNFDQELKGEKAGYVIEGTLTITINENTFTVNPGDVFYVPQGSKVNWGSPNETKLFYIKYPAS